MFRTEINAVVRLRTQDHLLSFLLSKNYLFEFYTFNLII